MAIIGIINIGMSVSTAGLAKGLTTARGALSSFSSAISTTGAAVSGFIAAVGAGAAIAGITALTKASLQAIDDTADMAAQLGTSAGALVALQYAAKLTGGDVEALSGSLQKMGINLSKATVEGGSAADVFKRLGLDAGELKSLDPSEAFAKIAGAISEVSSPADQAAAAMEIFGKSGVGLINTLKAGPEALSQLTAEADKLGISLSDVDAAKVGAANDALDRAGYAISGVGNVLAVQLAPFIEVAAKKFVEFATSGIDTGKTVATALEWVASGVGIVADVVHTLKLAFMALQSGVSQVLAWILKGITTLVQGLESLINKLPGVKVAFSETLNAIAEDMQKLSGEQWQNTQKEFLKEPPSTGIKSFFDDVKTQAQAAAEAITKTGTSVNAMGDQFTQAASKVAELEEKLKVQVATFGMSSEQIEIYKLKQEGVSEAMLGNVQALSQQLKSMEEKKKLQDDLKSQAQQVIEATRTPLEKYEAEISKLKTLLESGNIDQTTFDRASEKAQKDLGGKPPEKKLEFAAALELGSNETRQAVLRNRGIGAKDPMNKLEQNTKDTAVAQKDAIVVLKQILAKTGVEEVFTF